ncbi:toxin [Microbacterium sp. No. 7]|uniref:toxin n=1 Tax=Microbacterium sp. No. 7 TaxID=1714373 RepID=UPI0006D17AEF|nr:toxin [Microbacterium sp. No. 7]ALJ21527.1 toxin [Microbacterium sp. No. 7]
MPSAARRLRIVGVSGSGKSSLAERVAERTGWPRLELDAVFWDAGWAYRDLDEARRVVRGFADAHPDAWVVDGNWSSRMQGLLDPGEPGGADVVVWLDHPRAVVMRRVIARTLRRGLTREELWHGNRERPATWLRWKPEENIVRWSWVQFPVMRERMLRRIAEGEPVLRLRGQRAVEAWLDTLPRRSVRP